jgi:hypothetical protein
MDKNIAAVPGRRIEAEATVVVPTGQNAMAADLNDLTGIESGSRCCLPPYRPPDPQKKGRGLTCPRPCSSSPSVASG